MKFMRSIRKLYNKHTIQNEKETENDNEILRSFIITIHSAIKTLSTSIPSTTLVLDRPNENGAKIESTNKLK